MKEVVLINGKQQSTLSVFNRLIQFGDGLFETCVAENTSLLFWSQHFERLEKGRIQLKINPVSEKVWLEDISVALRVANMIRRLKTLSVDCCFPLIKTTSFMAYIIMRPS
jgi:4-amino-4-deoxychorismate lyase